MSATAAETARAARRPSRVPGLVLGLGLGGFIDGIVLHQVLQWHHLLTSAGQPDRTVEGLEANTLADGFFHLGTYALVVAGLFGLWHMLRGGADVPGRWLLGLILAGWGAFNIVEGIVNHQILTIHHVNAGSSIVAWDLAFLALGGALLAGGLALARHHPPATAGRPAEASARALR